MKSMTYSQQRTRLANIRTLLSYIRTSMMLLTVALAMYKLDKSGDLDWVVWVFGIACVGTLIVGIVSYCVVSNMITKGDKLYE